jgi:hypothetical protein
MVIYFRWLLDLSIAKLNLNIGLQSGNETTVKIRGNNAFKGQLKLWKTQLIKLY